MATTGEISAAEWQELRAHLAECASCRSVFADAGEIHSHWLPERPDVEISRDPKSDGALRGKILLRASRAGAHLSKAAQAKPALFDIPITREQRQALWAFLRPSLAPATVIAVVMLTLVVAAFLGLGLRRHAPGEQQAAISQGHATAGNQAAVTPAPHIPRESTVQEAAAIKQRNAALEAALHEAQLEKDRVQRQLSEAENRVGAYAQADAEASERMADLQRQLEAAIATQAKAETELARVKDAENADQVVLSTQEQAIRDLNSKLEEQTASLDRERQLLSLGREVRDVIAARNLHIVDVYDTDGNGKTKKAFGRAFYTEGKSLIFYAYDLPTHRIENAKYAYYGWGKRDDGNQRTVRSLGILYKDDQAQKRWVLKVTDPEVLAQIDSVFVTLERTDKRATQPHGKELLSAYLRSPANHP